MWCVLRNGTWQSGTNLITSNEKNERNRAVPPCERGNQQDQSQACPWSALVAFSRRVPGGENFSQLSRPAQDENGFTVIVAITPSVILSEADTLPTASKSGSLSSCKSLLYVDGRPFKVIKNPAIWNVVSAQSGEPLHTISAMEGKAKRRHLLTFPNIRPDLPRNNSRESGFFF
jgi:hypothetical protein